MPPTAENGHKWPSELDTHGIQDLDTPKGRPSTSSWTTECHRSSPQHIHAVKSCPYECFFVPHPHLKSVGGLRNNAEFGPVLIIIHGSPPSSDACIKTQRSGYNRPGILSFGNNTGAGLTLMPTGTVSIRIELNPEPDRSKDSDRREKKRSVGFLSARNMKNRTGFSAFCTISTARGTTTSPTTSLPSLLSRCRADPRENLSLASSVR